MKWLSLMLAMWAAAAQAATYHVCAEPWTPFIYRAEGKPAGLVVDILNKVAHQRGDDLDYRFISSDGCARAMREGQADMVGFMLPLQVPAGWMTSRELLVAWVLFPWVRRDGPASYRGLEDFAGKRVAWVTAYDYPQLLIRMDKWRRVPAEDTESSMMLLAHGRVEVVFDDPTALAGLSPAMGQKVKRLQPLVASVNQPIAFRPGMSAWRDAVDKETLRAQQDGTLDGFYRRYHGVPFREVKQSLRP